MLMDTSAPSGSKLDPAFAAEVAAVAPGNIEPGEVDTIHLADESVTRPKIAPGAVDSPQIATGGVKAVNVAAGAVGTPALADGAVTAAKAGVGVVTAYDSAGNPVTRKEVEVTTAQYNALVTAGTVDPNTRYFVS
ncbi:hypothetical protein SEA_ALANGRANT_39 [Mycobacterium phage AlanGrant]|uniref:Uncharacterized protein n=1 Tax=Mycobacterium phage AlanGrant TaxID=1647307 RepID=A0A0F6WEB2_9CAUD|nr:hypothetical protein SEA_ALANGRANT_39 [Mycobacterium phage AlanGrant]